MPTIAGIATGNTEFSILVDTLVYLDGTLGTSLVATLDTPGADLTVFAPTNAAFALLAADRGYAGDPADASAISAFLQANVPAATLLAVIQYHVSPTTQLEADLADGGSISTLLGASITRDGPTLIDNEPDLIDPTITGPDNIATNGVVHIIDRVLLPVDLPGNSAPTITGIVASSGPGFDANPDDFDMLLAAVTTAGLDGLLNDPSIDVTVFAPRDGAFVGLSAALGYSGTDEAGAFDYLVEALTLLGGGDPLPLLETVLTYHVAGESLQSAQVLGASGIPTLQGGSLGVSGATLVDADPDIADPNIVGVDIQAANGIVHVLDGVLLPADLLASDGSNDVDFVIAGDAKDFIYTGADRDFVDGNGGNDRISSGSGDDVVLGGAGHDRIIAGSGDDLVRGDAGRDKLLGRGGRDTLDGGEGNDLLAGGSHKDVLIGGAGNDLLIGGGGADTLVFGPGSDHDTVLGFRSGSDKIDLTAYGFADYAEVQGNTDRGLFGTSIDLGDGDSIFLVGLFGVHVTESDFIL